jgi:hypothetical protein
LNLPSLLSPMAHFGLLHMFSPYALMKSIFQSCFLKPCQLLFLKGIQRWCWYMRRPMHVFKCNYYFFWSTMHTLIEAHKIVFKRNFVRFYQCMHGVFIGTWEDLCMSSLVHDIHAIQGSLG